jgi:hypothetical protein
LAEARGLPHVLNYPVPLRIREGTRIRVVRRPIRSFGRRPVDANDRWPFARVNRLYIYLDERRLTRHH